VRLRHFLSIFIATTLFLEHFAATTLSNLVANFLISRPVSTFENHRKMFSSPKKLGVHREIIFKKVFWR